MWPVRGEAISRTLECEAALADLYAEALNQWVVTARPFAVPTMTAAASDADLPPDPDAVEQNSANWDLIAAELIVAGVAVMWALALVEAMQGLGVSLPEFGDIDLGGRAEPVISRAVYRSITSTSSVTRAEIRYATTYVESRSELRQSREDYVSKYSQTVQSATSIMRDKVTAAVRDVTPDPVVEPVAIVEPVSVPTPLPEPIRIPRDNRTDPMRDDVPTPTIEPTPSVEVVVERQREAAASVLTPGSEAVRDVARYSGYQAAGVQNAAVLEAAQQVDIDDDEILQKVWIATLDGKTRDTHFRADGQRVPIDGHFAVGAALLEFPADPTGPPEEIRNCRCRMGILAEDEPLPDEVDRHTERLDGRDSVQVRREGTQRDEIERRANKGVVRARDAQDRVGTVASGGWTAPSEQEYSMTVTTEVAMSTGETYRTFTDQPIAFVGIETSDGRMLADGIKFDVRTPPMPVMWVEQTGAGHEDAYTVGVMEAARVEDGKVLASGYILNSPEADKAAGQLQHTASRPSVDLARVEWKLTDVDGNEITEEQWWDMPADAKVIQTITAAELIGVTLVATPAFGDTMLSLNSERESRDAAMVASAAVAFQPRVYAASLFADPKLTAPTLPSMDPDTGRIFGHLACFGACHRSIQQACVMAPRSFSGYAHFHTSPAVRLDDGTSLAVGRLTVGTGHAPDGLGGAPAKAHYDNTGACFALVRVGEDEHGIWFSGVAAPWATPEQIEQGMASPLSGDWRDFGQGLELIAALAVNTPGFAVRGRDGADGRPAALVASLGPNPHSPEVGVPATLTVDAVKSIIAETMELDALMKTARAKVGSPPAPKTPTDEIADMLAHVAKWH